VRVDLSNCFCVDSETYPDHRHGVAMAPDGGPCSGWNWGRSGTRQCLDNIRHGNTGYCIAKIRGGFKVHRLILLGF
jgi:hypothetical protein